MGKTSAQQLLLMVPKEITNNNPHRCCRQQPNNNNVVLIHVHGQVFRLKGGGVKRKKTRPASRHLFSIYLVIKFNFLEIFWGGGGVTTFTPSPPVHMYGCTTTILHDVSRQKGKIRSSQIAVCKLVSKHRCA